MRELQDGFRLTDSGINQPKIVIADGDDGVSRRQLVKGRDDLRQDAVMEQLFDLVNLLLQVQIELRKKKEKKKKRGMDNNFTYSISSKLIQTSLIAKK